MDEQDTHNCRPIIAITTDLIERNAQPTAMCTQAYAARVHAAGGIPILVPPTPQCVDEFADRFDAFVFTGGDDPATEPFGAPTHPKANLVHPARQRFETALLLTLSQQHPDKPVLGICLGMQMMALVAGGCLDQHLPDTHKDADRHWDNEHHVVAVGGADAPLASGFVRSRHKQAVSDTGALRVCARANDNIIEGVYDPRRAHYVGVQWHPERTDSPPLGQACFDALVSAIASPKQTRELTPAPASP